MHTCMNTSWQNGYLNGRVKELRTTFKFSFDSISINSGSCRPIYAASQTIWVHN